MAKRLDFAMAVGWTLAFALGCSAPEADPVLGQYDKRMIRTSDLRAALVRVSPGFRSKMASAEGRLRLFRHLLRDEMVLAAAGMPEPASQARLERETQIRKAYHSAAQSEWLKISEEELKARYARNYDDLVQRGGSTAVTYESVKEELRDRLIHERLEARLDWELASGRARINTAALASAKLDVSEKAP